MPQTALATLQATLDAASTIVGTHLTPRGGPHGRRAVLQRTCVVLCATAWEAYAEDSLIWAAVRAGASAQRPDGLASPGTALLADLVADAPRKLTEDYEKYRWRDTLKPVDPERAAEFERSKAKDQKMITGPWPQLLKAELTRQIIGVPYWDDSGFYSSKAMAAPRLSTLARHQQQIYGEPLIEHVRLPGCGPEYVEKWLGVLVEVRNASVHRGETPGLLNTRGVREWISFVGGVARELDRLILAWADRHLPAADCP